MVYYTRKLVKRYVIWGVILSFVGGILIPQNFWVYRVINGLFFAGVIVFGIGGISFASYLGGFDLFKYTQRKWSQYSKKNMDNPIKQEIGTYYDYMQSSKAKRVNLDFIIPVIIGFAFLVLAIILTSLFAF